MRYTLITQAALVIVSIVIIFTFIKPMAVGIKATQDELFQYSDALAKASKFNTRLSELIAQRDSFSKQDVATLENFVPSSIDTLKIMKDLEAIFASRNVPITSLAAKEIIAPLNNISLEGDAAASTKKAQKTTNYQDFDLAFRGNYTNLKDILLSLESSASLLEVTELSFDSIAKNVVPVGNDVNQPDQIQTNGDHEYKITVRSYGLGSTSK